MLCEKKYVLYAIIKPYDLKISLVFSKDSRVRYMQEFIEDTMRNFRTKYRVGRIEQQKTSSILLPDYKIGEVLEDKDEVVVYSAEYGLTKKTLSDKSSIEDIDKLFIGKKLKRDSRVITSKDSNDKTIKKKKKKGRMMRMIMRKRRKMKIIIIIKKKKKKKKKKMKKTKKMTKMRKIKIKRKIKKIRKMIIHQIVEMITVKILNYKNRFKKLYINIYIIIKFYI